MSTCRAGDLVSVQVGLPREFDACGSEGPAPRPWTSGIVKQPVAGPVAVEPCGIQGDGQADLVHHGGPDKAVLAYSADHYPGWRVKLELPQLSCGAFGENLTVAGTDESRVCIGDVWRVGEVLLQVSQPRQPCWKLGRRWQRPQLPKLVVQTGHSGWYLRVLTAGRMQSGVGIALEDRPHPEWTVHRVASMMYDKQAPPDAVAALARLAVLADSWREDFARRSKPASQA